MSGQTNPIRAIANNIGLIRLMLASLVIVSHETLLIDPAGGADPLRWISTLNGGGVAVDMFFLISGWLITQSWLGSASTAEYLVKRALRIFPAYFVVFWLSTLAAALIGGLKPGQPYWTVLFLGMPPVMLDGQTSNGALWTIAYEFRCYLLVLLLGFVRPADRWAWVAWTAGLALLSFIVVTALGGYATIPQPDLPYKVTLLFGRPWFLSRLIACFAVGAFAMLNRQWLERHVTGRCALISLFLCLVLINIDAIAEPALILFGGLCLYWFAFKADIGRFQKINDKVDISYGTYLYGSLIQFLIFTLRPDLNWWIQLILCLTLSWAAGWLSWTLIEEPALRLKRHVIWRSARSVPG